MVKTRTLFLAAIAALVATLCGCAARAGLPGANAESLVISRAPTGASLSLALWGETLYALYADRSTTTLDMVAVPSGALPAEVPAAEVIDKVDVSPPLSGTFGAHVFSISEGIASVLYLDRETDEKSVLKLASRPLSVRQWNLDILEPPGDPLAILTDSKGVSTLFWSAGSVFARRARPAGQPSLFYGPFQLEGGTGSPGPVGFTAYNGEAHSLLAVRPEVDGLAWTTVPAAGPVHASLIDADGLLSILSWNQKTRRLILQRESSAARGRFSSITVTVCDGTGSVALLPGRTDGTFAILFDETRDTGGGKTLSQLSLVAPGEMTGGQGTRYRKTVLSSGEARINAFAALKAAGALFVLISREDLRLLRLPLAQ